MKEKFLNSIFPIEIINSIQSGFEKNKVVNVSNAYGSSKAILTSMLFQHFQKLVILVDKSIDIDELFVELSVLGLSDFLISLNSNEEEVIQERLTNLAERNNYILIAEKKILITPLPSPKEISGNTLKIELGTNLTYNELLEYFSLYNYQRDKFVQNPGDFATRGSIIDFWSYSEKLPVRVEFDGDFIESIRYFDSESQRSIGKTEKITLAGNLVENQTEKTNATIFDFINQALIVTSQKIIEQLFDNPAEEKTTKEEDLDDELVQEIFENTIATKPDEKSFLSTKTFDELLTNDNYWLLETELSGNKNRIELGIVENPIFKSNFKLLASFISEQCNSEKNIFITTENEIQKNRLTELLTEINDDLEKLIDEGKVKILILPIKKGFTSRNSNFIILTDYEIFNKPYRTKPVANYQKYKSRAKDIASLRIGDFVVHETFGIGKYAGLETIKIGAAEQESIKILYAEGDVVYVNLNYLSLVKKFSSKENVEPKVTNLKSSEWKSTKRKVKAKIKDAARELIMLYAKRKSSKGFAFSADTLMQKELEASFMYEDTPDQTKVTEEVKIDMQSETPMDRLVCGDVGFGKTEIAVRAAFKAVNDGKQAAVLVPTTILAEQHYNTFSDRLSQFPVRVEMLSRFVQPKKQKEILSELEKGNVDIIIGTHRLISDDVKFKDLGLLVIDEEQRFGVMAKEKIKSRKLNVDNLTLTATPIPRTLNLSLLGARDLSLLGTPPPNRQPIYTKVAVFDIHKVRQWILEEVRRGGQVYFIHDRINTIEKIASYLKKYIPEVNFRVAHGQMKALQLENVIHDFLNKKFEVLLSTKIVESGLDIPNVNTIIINRADRFGLAELHQLRGRVGRSDKQAYAYLLVPSLDLITKKAVRRLNSIEEYTELGEGFNIAMRDLEIRGAGNLLGTEQSGVIDSVGFDLYIKLLDEAVNELKQDEFKNEFKDLPKVIEKSSPTIDTYFSISIPKKYIPDQTDRLSFYTSLFSIIKISELDEIKEEMIDRFGKPSEEIDRLLLAAKLRFYASEALLERIVVQEKIIQIYMPKAEREEYYQKYFIPTIEFINKSYPKEIKLIQQKDVLKLEMKNRHKTPEEVLDFLINFCKNIAKFIS